MLRTEAVTKRFNGVLAVDACSIEIEQGKITGLIGPNGAGKTSLFSILSGFIKPDAGAIFYKDRNITRMPPYQVFRQGICRTFQISREFKELTVLENLTVVPSQQTGERLLTPFLRPFRVAAEEREIRRKAHEVLELVGLRELANEKAWRLSVGQRRLLDFGRAIIAGAELLLLDEPAAGVSPTLRAELARYMRWICAERGITILLVEHDMDLVMNTCQTIFVMAAGSILISGKPDDVRKDQRVLDAYLSSKG
jgi:branched-chain amino acid transport system ATP-binding protein